MIFDPIVFNDCFDQVPCQICHARGWLGLLLFICELVLLSVQWAKEKSIHTLELLWRTSSNINNAHATSREARHFRQTYAGESL
jgi:hypothetical protein